MFVVAGSAFSAVLEAARGERTGAQSIGACSVPAGFCAQRGVHGGDHGCVGGNGDLRVRSAQLGERNRIRK